MQTGAGAAQVLDAVAHALHVGPGQLDVRVCVIDPVCPVGHESVWVCDGSGVQDTVVQTRRSSTHVAPLCHEQPLGGAACSQIGDSDVTVIVAVAKVSFKPGTDTSVLKSLTVYVPIVP